MKDTYKYELWMSGGGDSYDLFRSDDGENKRLLDEDAVLLRTFHVRSYEEAAKLMHEYLGWEPYKPMDG